jgi:hypothetical protein
MAERTALGRIQNVQQKQKNGEKASIINWQVIFI